MGPADEVGGAHEQRGDRASGDRTPTDRAPDESRVYFAPKWAVIGIFLMLLQALSELAKDILLLGGDKTLEADK